MDQGIAFAAELSEEIAFDTVGDPPKMILAWVVKDLAALEEVVWRLNPRNKGTQPRGLTAR